MIGISIAATSGCLWLLLSCYYQFIGRLTTEANGCDEVVADVSVTAVLEVLYSLKNSLDERECLISAKSIQAVVIEISHPYVHCTSPQILDS